VHPYSIVGSASVGSDIGELGRQLGDQRTLGLNLGQQILAATPLPEQVDIKVAISDQVG
jgi:hypothetical protein